MASDAESRVEPDRAGPARMRAVVCRRYGTPDALTLEDVERPAPAAGRVLVRVLASSVNAGDWHRMHGAPLLRLFTGLRRPKDPRLGTDIAGRVEAVGAGVTRFQPGDEVFGAAQGGLAEFAVAREDRIVPKPTNVSFDQAGAVAVAATTALQGLRDQGHLRAGQDVLINGASGGVGTFAVQIAKAYGAEVTAVCSPRNLEQARSLGADHIIDYTLEDFGDGRKQYDLILDVVGNHSGSAYRRALRPGGVCIIVGCGFPRVSWGKFLGLLVGGPLRSRLGNKRVQFMGEAKLSGEGLTTLGEFLRSGKVVPAVDRRYALIETAEALRYLGQGHARGKVVVTTDRGSNAPGTSPDPVPAVTRQASLRSSQARPRRTPPCATEDSPEDPEVAGDGIHEARSVAVLWGGEHPMA